MPRFQLRILEPGREQSRLVRLESPVVVGRSARADVAVDDKELGRKQFRIGEDRGFVVLEALGTTNATLVDGRALQAGERTTVVAGSRIRVGKTEFMIEVCEQTAEMRTPRKSPEDDTGQVVTDATMVKGFRPGGDPPAPPAPPPQDDEFSPGVTMARGFRPGGAPPPPAQPPAAPPPSDEFSPDVTMAKGFRPGGAPPPPAQPPAAPPPSDDVSPDVTMAKGFRPGGAPPPPAQPPAAPPSSDDVSPDVTMARGFRPGATPPPAEQPTAPPPSDDAAPDVTMVGGFRPGGAQPPPAAQQAQPPAAAPTPTAPAAPTPTAPAAPAPAPASDSAIHAGIQTWRPRLFVKGVGLKRTIALIRGRNRIGNAEEAEVSIPHESVAERHADICFDGERWTLLDMGSHQGSNVDGAAVRDEARALRHNSLIAVGAARAVFLCEDPKHASADRRAEQRALGLLTKRGDLHQSDVRELRERCGDGSMAEVVLRDTGVSAEQWAAATREARERTSLLGRILRLFGIGR